MDLKKIGRGSNSVKVTTSRRGLTFTIAALSFLSITIFLGTKIIWAEQQGTTPESGSISHLKSLSSDLAGLTLGSETNSPDWGTMWNRVATAAKWVPQGTATANDVSTGKTFYSDSRDTKRTGSYQQASDCPGQTGRDRDIANNPPSNCGLTWVTTSPAVSGDDKQDPRTGLVWSQSLYIYNNIVQFSVSNNSFWSWDASYTNNINAGNKTALQLCSDRGNSWRLPTQKELIQAYIDGFYYNVNDKAHEFWSATSKDSTNAISMDMGSVDIKVVTKSAWNPRFIKCVRSS